MTENTHKQTPYDRFKEAVRKVISAPKDEVDKEIAARKGGAKEPVKPKAPAADK